MAVTVGQLADGLGAEIRGNADLVIVAAQPIDAAGPQDITFVADKANVQKLRESRAGAALISPCLSDSLNAERTTLILVEDAHSAFVEILSKLRPRRPRSKVGVSPQAHVSATARIGRGTNIFPGAFVGDDVVIGENCDIYPGAFIGHGCRLGDNVTIYPHVVIYGDVSIGSRVILHASAIVGADGFGYRLTDGRHQKTPHFGTVRVEDDVEIGACTTVDRAMIGETVVGEGTKLDNLVMIAHNCRLGRHNMFVSQVGLAGSVTTGDYVVCAGQVGVADHVHLGNGCVLGSKSGVHKNLTGGQRYFGSPALPESEAKRNLMAQKKSADTRKRVRLLETRIAELSERLDKLAEDGEFPTASAA